jgi:uncharacterized membrane protein YbhN (UPF0104 family)
MNIRKWAKNAPSRRIWLIWMIPFVVLGLGGIIYSEFFAKTIEAQAQVRHWFLPLCFGALCIAWLITGGLGWKNRNDDHRGDHRAQ